MMQTLISSLPMQVQMVPSLQGQFIQYSGLGMGV